MNINAVSAGIALGLVVFLLVAIAPAGRDDYSKVFYPATQVKEPYNANSYFWYPVWNLWSLHILALLPRQVALLVIWLFNCTVVFWICPHWRTSPWVVFISPPFFVAMLFGHPFEAIFVAGITFVLIGWAQSPILVGLGLCLMLFKPQLAVVPGLLISLEILRVKQLRLALLFPIALAAFSTTADFALTGRLWIIPFLQVLHQPHKVLWNASLWGTFQYFSLLWIPLGIWLLRQMRGYWNRRLFVAITISLLVVPYWWAASLWPLVAMLGCWTKESAMG